MSKNKASFSESQSKKPNSLINETSPYLLQHAYNPVNWYPWSDQSLKIAKNENKPILLSIGYSACHWCHVMAHESFEDENTAEVMNNHFINIKVDREERPDLDKIYQNLQELLTQRTGGWPLTMILDPNDQVPFFGGTYFPPEARFGLPGFKEILIRITELYQNEKEAINNQNMAIKKALKEMQQTTTPLTSNLNLEPITRGVLEIMNYFDSRYGGFGEAPKFPQTPKLEFLLSARPHLDSNLTKSSMEAVNFSLLEMGSGGIYDHLGGGFCRYTIDRNWSIPHFEKMLYDNGLLLFNYAQAWQLYGNKIYHQITRETADWLIRDMQSDEGGYYSSLDADSEEEEGKFYLWTPEEIKTILSDQEEEIFSEYYGLNNTANFEGSWHLRINTNFNKINKNVEMCSQLSNPLLASARKKLLKVRNKRVWPGCDKKILTSWNALAIKGMSIAALRLNDETYLRSAEKALEFIYDVMWNDNRLLASYKDGKAHLNAYLDDYVYLIDALLTILAIQWNSKWVNFALNLASVLMEQFYKPEGGGFYFTSHDHETLLQRRLDYMDGATPSGNGVAIQVLLQLGYLTGNQKFLDAAEKTLRAAWDPLSKNAHAHASLLTSLCTYNQPPQQIIIRGDAENIKKWQKHCYETAQNMDMRIYAIPNDAENLPDLLAKRIPQDTTVAYVCNGLSCQEPVKILKKLIHDLKKQAHE